MNDTGIYLKDLYSYKIMVINQLDIADAFIKTDSAGYDRLWMIPFKFLLRYPKAKWFTLIGSINKRDDFEIGLSRVIEVKNPGTLFCYFNDVPGFYFNNKGQAVISIDQVCYSPK